VELRRDIDRLRNALYDLVDGKVKDGPTRDRRSQIEYQQGTGARSSSNAPLNVRFLALGITACGGGYAIVVQN
jgi:hypothetical protein